MRSWGPWVIVLDVADFSIDEAAVRRLAQFVFNRESDNLRAELHCFLVGLALSSVEIDRALNVEQIQRAIEDLFKLAGFPQKPIEESIQLMLNAGKIKEVGLLSGRGYQLTSNKRDELEGIASSYERIQNVVEDELVTRAVEIMGKVSKSKRTKIVKCFALALGHLIAQPSTSAAALSLGIGPKVIPASVDEVGACIYLAVCEHFGGKNRENVVQLIASYLANPTDTLALYLNAIGQSYYVIQILHLDPECQKIVNRNLSATTVYLDTNAILFLLIGGKREKKAISQLVEMTRDLGVSVRATLRTKEEFLRVVDSKRSLLEAVQIPKERLRKARSIVRDGFLSDFMEKKEANPSLTAEGYLARLELFERILLKWDVEFEETEFGVIAESEEYAPLCDMISELRPRKSEGVVEHDALHILQVRKLRESSTPGITGPRFWFLTFDSSLQKAESIFRERRRIPSSIYPDQWLQMLSPMLSVDTTTKDVPMVYASLFASRIPAAGALLTEEDLLKIQGSWMDDEDLDEQDIAWIAGNEHVRNYISTTDSDRITVEGLKEALIPIVKEAKDRKKREIQLIGEISAKTSWLRFLAIILTMMLDIALLLLDRFLFALGLFLQVIAVAVIFREQIGSHLRRRRKRLDS